MLLKCSYPDNVIWGNLRVGVTYVWLHQKKLIVLIIIDNKLIDLSNLQFGLLPLAEQIRTVFYRLKNFLEEYTRSSKEAMPLEEEQIEN